MVSNSTNNNYQLIVILAPLLMTVLFVDGLTAQPNRNQVENFANLAEKISDRQHTKYCEKFGQTFKEKSDVLWPKIHQQCIEKMVRDGTQLPANFPKIDADMRKKIIMIFEVCAPPVKNPCIPEEWATIKRCIRDESFNTKLLEVNGKQALPKNVPSISLGLASAVLDCTDKVVRAGPV